MTTVTISYPGGGEGWTRTVELSDVPRVGDTIDTIDGSYEVRRVVWTLDSEESDEPEPIPYVIVRKP